MKNLVMMSCNPFVNPPSTRNQELISWITGRTITLNSSAQETAIVNQETLDVRNAR